jgi:hypothetical protein
MTIRPKHLLIASALCGVTGIALGVITYNAWREYQSYTVEAEGVVVPGTETIVVSLTGEIPGGQATVECAYSALTGGRASTPEATADLKPGDKLALLHPPGRPSDARLAEGFAPAVPPRLAWVSAGLIGLAVGGLSVAWRWQTRLSASRRTRRTSPVPVATLPW